MYRLMAPLTLLAGWELAARLGVANTLLFPAPSKAIGDLMVMASSGYLWRGFTQVFTASFAASLSRSWWALFWAWPWHASH
jgi:ABC-type nitrate/sulfonate/bicarbonate transport system permease component